MARKKKIYDGLDYRQYQRRNSKIFFGLSKREQRKLRARGYWNVGWDKVRRSWLILQEYFASPEEWEPTTTPSAPLEPENSVVQQEVPQEPPQQPPTQVSERVPEQVPEQVPQQVPEQVPEQLPEQQPKQEQVPEQVSEEAKGNFPQAIFLDELIALLRGRSLLMELLRLEYLLMLLTGL